jgi:dipeptidyl aminopeptidase/acylaminoacyl peptidase
VILKSPAPLSSRSGDINSDPSLDQTIEVDTKSGQIEEVGAECDEPVKWDNRRQTLDCIGSEPRISSADGVPGGEPKGLPIERRHRQFLRTQSGWREIARDSPVVSHPLLYVREDFATPPKVVAIDQKTGKKKIVLNLNPQLENLSLTHVEEIAWKTAAGEGIKAGLFFPLNFKTGERYPLVIQTHGWQPARFHFNGYVGAGYVAATGRSWVFRPSGR